MMPNRPAGREGEAGDAATGHWMPPEWRRPVGQGMRAAAPPTTPDGRPVLGLDEPTTTAMIERVGQRAGIWKPHGVAGGIINGLPDGSRRPC